MSSIDTRKIRTNMEDEILGILEHWKDARENELRGNKEAINENLRCAVDLTELLRQQGIEVPKNLFKIQ